MHPHSGRRLENQIVGVSASPPSSDVTLVLGAGGCGRWTARSNSNGRARLAGTGQLDPIHSLTGAVVSTPTAAKTTPAPSFEGSHGNTRMNIAQPQASTLQSRAPHLAHKVECHPPYVRNESGVEKTEMLAQPSRIMRTSKFFTEVDSERFGNQLSTRVAGPPNTDL